ncbi:putative dehydrogenase [Kribbella sp. VKM Ac-2527]|uniref:Putative dehydrogenase n=1 Tax=Kribbella caucasensis TaxID=2512215 RepID=A0A4V3CAP2_9ACTN|nr:Gfo/Idh/MocA family oxidoreductase [Kribbella sp. VKM Ac-2527]TDO51642.1 putative dehydrogenase [Kribbella sp. VKM Ac-2527]
MLRIGILGAADIAVESMLLPVSRRNDALVVAVASRSAGAEYARKHGIDRSYDTYEALLADPEIDLVYNALPPSAHAEWSIAALRAGKHVLCEKPFTMTAAEASRVLQAARATDRRVVEAFHDHYHPLSAWIRETVSSGRLGAVRRADAVFTGANAFVPNTLRHEPALGGGALMDLGCYPVHWLRALFGDAPQVREAKAELNPAGADRVIDARLSFDDEVEATVHASMAEGVQLRSSLSIEAERGILEVDNIVFPSAGHSIRFVLDDVPHRCTVAGRQTYDHQLEAVVAALRTGDPLPTEGADSVSNMTVIDEIYAAAGFDRPWM